MDAATALARFAATIDAHDWEGLRALLHGGSLGTAQVWVFVGLAAAGLLVLLLPGKKAQPDLADGVVDVGVDQADRLPGAQHQRTA